MAFIYSCDNETSALTIAHMLNGIEARVKKEEKLKGTGSDSYKQIISTMRKHAKRVVRLDNMTLAFIAHNPELTFSEVDTGGEAVSVAISFPAIFTSQRREGDCFNEKAIPKIFCVSRVLNGGTFFSYGKGEQSDNETTRATVLALASGITKGKLIANFVDQYMSDMGRGGGTYHNGSTQSSSSLRALEALGVVAKATGTTWQIVDKPRFARLLEGANDIPYNVPADNVPHASVPAILALPAPEGMLMLTYDNGGVHLANNDADVSAFLAELLADGVDETTAHEIVEAAVSV